MKSIFSTGALTLALGALTFTGCGEEKSTLHIYCWGDFMSDGVVERFEEAYNCNVKIDVFDSNEAMYAKIKAGAGGYDILVPSSYMAKLMNEQNMLSPLDLNQLPDVTKNFDPAYANLSLDPQMSYCVPYFVSFSGIGYDTKYVSNFEPTWHMFEREDVKHYCSLLSDLRETIGCALLTLGYDPNSTDPAHVEQAVALLLKWKENIAKFEVDDAKRALASGEFKMIHTYNGDMLQVASEKPTVRFIIPKEGATVTFDNFVITKDSQNKALAHQFINFFYQPDNAAQNMNEIMYVMPNVAAIPLVDEALRNNPAFTIPEAQRATCKPLVDLGQYNDLYNKAWDRIRQ